MKLALKRPLIIFDLEATGTDVAKDRIVEIAMLKIHPNGTEETYHKRINPEMPIPAEATKVHGISDSDVANCPTFKNLAREIAKFIEGCDLAGYNSNKLDIPMLAEELLRAGTDFDLRRCRFVDVQNIFHKMEKRTLSAAYKFYCNKSLENAHSALADTRATYEILLKQIEMYENVPYEDEKGNKIQGVVNDIEALSKFTTQTQNVDFLGRIVLNENGIPIFNFGKYKGVAVEKVFEKDPGYFGWVLNSDFPEHTKKVLTEIKLRMKNR